MYTSKTDYRSILMTILGMFFIILDNDTPFITLSWLIAAAVCVCVCMRVPMIDYIGILRTLISQ